MTDTLFTNQPSGASRPVSEEQKARPDAMYRRLLLWRLLVGLLSPFACSRCGCLALDPIGWDGPRRPLCGRCADGEKVPL